MQKRVKSSIRRRDAVSPSTSERRTKLRLRELCDEVIASFRVANGSETFSDVDRAEANLVLARLTPALPRSA